MKRIPTLDGWRGIAILMVLCEHLTLSLGYGSSHGWLLIGQHGVTVFFVLSGYLITTHLLEQGDINLPRFYIKRFFRLLPAAWTFLLVLYLLTTFTHMRLIGSDVWGCLFFYRNYVTWFGHMPTQHFWSLSIEEQFYLLWPGVLVLFGRRNAAGVLIVGVIGVTAFRFTHWIDHYSDLASHTEMCADKIMLGGLLAFALQQGHVQDWFKRYGRWVIAIAGITLLVDISAYHVLIPVHEGIAVALLIGATVMNPDSVVSRVLEIEHLKTTGKMSYSIYLWQQLCLRPEWGLFAFALLSATAFASWQLIEQPCIRLGAKLANKKFLKSRTILLDFVPEV